MLISFYSYASSVLQFSNSRSFYVSETYSYKHIFMSDFYFVGASECFPSETKIRLENGKIVKMSELQKELKQVNKKIRKKQ